MQLCRNPAIRNPLFGQYAIFFRGVLPKQGPPGAPSILVCLAHTLFVRSEVGVGRSRTDSGFTSSKYLPSLGRVTLFNEPSTRTSNATITRGRSTLRH